MGFMRYGAARSELMGLIRSYRSEQSRLSCLTPEGRLALARVSKKQGGQGWPQGWSILLRALRALCFVVLRGAFAALLVARAARLRRGVDDAASPLASQGPQKQFFL